MKSASSRICALLLLSCGSAWADEPSFSTPSTPPPTQAAPPAQAAPAAPPPPPPAPLVQVPPPAPVAAPQSTIDSLNKALGIYVFPSKGQAPEQQQKEMNECHAWAVQQSGVDPLTTAQTQVAKVDGPPPATGAVGGAAKGALVGAAVGAISGNAGTGAAVGATVGGLKGIKRRKQQQAQAQAAAEAEAKKADAAKLASFKKAYTVCLEGKGYTAR